MKLTELTELWALPEFWYSENRTERERETDNLILLSTPQEKNVLNNSYGSPIDDFAIILIFYHPSYIFLVFLHKTFKTFVKWFSMYENVIE